MFSWDATLHVCISAVQGSGQLLHMPKTWIFEGHFDMERSQDP